MGPHRPWGWNFGQANEGHVHYGRTLKQGTVAKSDAERFSIQGINMDSRVQGVSREIIVCTR